MTLFTRKTINYSERGKACYLIFTLPQLIVGELGRTRWIGNSSKTHSLGLVNRVDQTLKKMLQFWSFGSFFSGGGGGGGGWWDLGVKKDLLKSGLALPKKMSGIILHLSCYLWETPKLQLDPTITSGRVVFLNSNNNCTKRNPCKYSQYITDLLIFLKGYDISWLLILITNFVQK